MQSHPSLAGLSPPTSFLSLPFELRHQIYDLILRSLPRVKPMRYSTTIPIYCLQNLDPRPLFVHPQIQHDIQALLASHTRIQIPALLGHDGKSTLSPPTHQWLQESSIEFGRVRVWSDLPVPIILDVDVLVGAEREVHYTWRWRPCRFRIYGWGLAIVRPALPIMLAYLADALRKRVSARGGSGMGAEEIDFLMESMGRFRSWFDVHRRFRSWDTNMSRSWYSRLSPESYEEALASLRHAGDEEKAEFRRLLEWWDEVEAEVRELKMAEGRVLL